MRLYHQISLEEREKIHLFLQEGLSLGKIAINLNRVKSTISREIKRNTCSKIGYTPDRADRNAEKRAYKAISKIDKYPELESYITDRLQQDKWSPEAIAGVLKNDRILPLISHETIYKFIYSREGQKLGLYKNLMYRRPLRQAKFSRIKRYRIPEANRIENRPENINQRSELGHAEGDLTFFTGSLSQNVLTTIDRSSRMITLKKNNNKRSNSTILQLTAISKKMGYKSITFDNGTEFSKYATLELKGVKVYFCNPHSPWEKGFIERMHASLHKFIPKKTNINSISDQLLALVEFKMNNLPRKCLGYLTPQQFYDKTIANGVALQT